ncbi:MAG TPA: hypothetical protein VFE30_02270 [Anaeromyxobacteraceae bacterium]|jgi:hypothetical protein|nr:hypothetical protein [Anaeromyxobacteraceae bacterium]
MLPLAQAEALPAPGPASQRARRPAAGTAAGLLAALALAALLRRVSDPDLFWHLSTGREVLRAGRIPVAEPFVSVLFGQPTQFHEWGYGVLCEAVLRVFGWAGLSVLQAGLMGGALALAGAAWPRRGRAGTARLLAFAAGAAWMSYRLSYRPELLLFLAIGLELWALERWDATGRARWLALLPASALGLSQAHPSALFLLVVLGACGVQVSLNEWRTGRLVPRLAQLGAAGAVTAAAACLNPFGPLQLLLPLRTATADVKEFADGIVELLPVLQSDQRWPFLLLAAAAAAAVAVAPRDRRVFWGLLAAGFGALAFRYVRNLALFALAVQPALAHLLARGCGWCGRRGGRAFRTALVAAGVGALAAVSILPRGGPGWGWGVAPGIFPEKSADAIQALRPRGTIFNFFDYGGYLNWALGGHWLVSVDGRRWGMDPAVTLHDRVLSADAGWDGALRAIGADVLVFPGTLPYSGKLVPLLSEILDSPDWLLLGSEEAALFFVRRGATAPPQPPALPASEAWRHVAWRAEQVASSFPDHPGAWLSLARAREALGEREAAQAAWARYQAAAQATPGGD